MSTKKPASKTINGHLFHVGIIPATKAIDTIGHLAALVQPVLSDAIDLREKFAGKDASKLSSEDVAKALTALTKALGGGGDATARKALIKDLASVTQVEKDGHVFRLASDDDFNAIFSGDGLPMLLDWIVFATTENFGPFLRGLLAR